MPAAVDRDHVKPSALLEKQSHVLRALYDLYGVGGIDRARQTEGQTGARVITVFGMVVSPLGSAPFGKRKLGHALLVRSILGHVRHKWVLPDSTKIWLAVCCAR